MSESKAIAKQLKQVAKVNQRGLANAEYAVGIVGVITFGGILIKLLKDPSFQKLLWDLIQWLLELIMKMLPM